MDQLPLTMDFSRAGQMSDEKFLMFCESNRDPRFERSAEGLITVMVPTVFWTGNLNSELSQQLSNWNDNRKMGTVVASSAGYKIPDSAIFSASASWISNARLGQVNKESLVRHLPACPEFVIELKSPSDSIIRLQKKMKSWIKNGVLLGWLIDPDSETVYVYRPQKSTLEINGFDQELSGEPVLPGFSLDLRELRG